MAFDRLLVNVCSDDLSRSRDFFVALLGFSVGYDSDWYVQLRHPENSNFELGILERTSDLIPEAFRTPPTGAYVTFVVPDVDATYAKAVDMGARILQAPRNEFYGQRRFLLTEPGGCLIDICSPWSEAEK